MNLKKTSLLLCIGLFLSACDHDSDSDTYCDDTRCYHQGIAYECSQDGKTIYKYISDKKYQLYEPFLVPGTNYMSRECPESSVCMINGNGIGECFKPCPSQKEGHVSWCEPYSPEGENYFGDHLFFNAECELINGQYVYPAYYNENTVANGSRYVGYLSEDYYTPALKQKASDTKMVYCPRDRHCNNNTGCLQYTENDGQDCSHYGNSKGTYSDYCVEVNGQTYARECFSPYISKEKYMTYTPCDICEVGSNGHPSEFDPYEQKAYCLEKCDSEGAVKYSCSDQYGIDYSTEWKCTKQSNGNTHWETVSTVKCPRHCGVDGKCVLYPGEGESCSTSTYKSSCIDDTTLMDCSNLTTGKYTVTVSDCRAYVLLAANLGIIDDPEQAELVCLGYDDEATCVPKKNITPCTDEGETKMVCREFEEATYALQYDYVCKKLSDGSLRYLATDIYVCDSSACNSAKTRCK